MANDTLPQNLSKELLNKRAKDVVEELISKLGKSNVHRKQLKTEVSTLTKRIDAIRTFQSKSVEQFRTREAQLLTELNDYKTYFEKFKLNQMRTRDVLRGAMDLAAEAFSNNDDISDASMSNPDDIPIGSLGELSLARLDSDSLASLPSIFDTAAKGDRFDANEAIPIIGGNDQDGLQSPYYRLMSRQLSGVSALTEEEDGRLQSDLRQKETELILLQGQLRRLEGDLHQALVREALGKQHAVNTIQTLQSQLDDALNKETAQMQMNEVVRLNLEGEIKRLTSLLSQRDQHLKEATMTLDHLSSLGISEDSFRNLQASIESNDEYYAELKAGILHSEKMRDTLKSELSDRNEAYEKVCQEMTELKIDMENLSSRERAGLSTVEALRSRICDLEEHLANSQSECASLRKAQESSANDLETRQSQLTTAVATCSALENQLHDLQQVHASKCNDMEQLQSEMEAMRGDLFRGTSSVNEVLSEAEDLKIRCDELQSQVSTLEADKVKILEEMKERDEMASIASQELESRLDSVVVELNELKLVHANKCKEMAQLQSEMEAMRGDLFRGTSSVNEVLSEAEDLKIRCDELQSQVSTLEADKVKILFGLSESKREEDKIHESAINDLAALREEYNSKCEEVLHLSELMDSLKEVQKTREGELLGEIEELCSQYEEVKRSLTDLMAEKEANHSTSGDSAIVDMTSLQSALNESETSKANLMTELTSITKELEDMKLVRESLQEELSEANSQLKLKQIQLSKVKKAQDDQSIDLARLQEENEELTARLAERESEVEELHMQLSGCSEVDDRKIDDFAKLQAVNEMLLARLTSEEQAHKASVESYDKLKMVQDSNDRELQLKCDDLEAQLIAADLLKVQLIRDHQAAVGDISVEIDALKMQLLDSVNEKCVVISELENLRKKCKDQSMELTQLRDQIEGQSISDASLIKTAEDLRICVRDLEGKLLTVMSENQSILEQLTTANGEVDSLKCQLEVCESTRDSLTEQSTALRLEHEAQLRSLGEQLQESNMQNKQQKKEPSLNKASSRLSIDNIDLSFGSNGEDSVDGFGGMVPEYVEEEEDEVAELRVQLLESEKAREEAERRLAENQSHNYSQEFVPDENVSGSDKGLEGRGLDPFETSAMPQYEEHEDDGDDAIGELKVQLLESEQVREEIETELSEAKQRIIDNSDSIRQLRSEVENLTLKEKKLTSRVEGLTAEASVLEKRLVEAETERETLRQDLQDAILKAEVATSEVSELEKRLVDVSTQLKAAQNTDRSESSPHGSEIREAELLAEIEELGARCEELENLVTELKQKGSPPSKSSQQVSSIKDLVFSSESLRGGGSLSASMLDMAEMASVEMSLAEMEEKVREAEERLEACELEREEAQQRNDQLQASMSVLQERLDQSEKQLKLAGSAPGSSTGGSNGRTQQSGGRGRGGRDPAVQALENRVSGLLEDVYTASVKEAELRREISRLKDEIASARNEK